MSFSGKMAYKMLKLMTTIFPSMKADFTDVDTELAKAKKINEKNKYVFPSDRKSLYKEISISGYPCLVIRSRKTENKRNKGLLFIYGGNTRQWKSEIAMARRYGDRTGMDVWYPIYPPITEVNIMVTISVLCDTYCRMVKKYGAENIAIVGDSLGGLFAAGIINHINRNQLEVGMPKLFRLCARYAGGLEGNGKICLQGSSFYSKCIPGSGLGGSSWTGDTQGHLLPCLHGFPQCTGDLYVLCGGALCGKCRSVQGCLRKSRSRG